MRGISIRLRIFLLIFMIVGFALGVGAPFYRELLALGGYATGQTQEAMLEGQKEKLKVAVHSMALTLGAMIRDVQDEAARNERIREAIKAIRFESDESGYYFVYQGTVNVALPTKPEAQGKDLGQTKDVNGVLFVRELSAQAEKGGGFVNYVFGKPGKGDQPKLAYAEMIPGSKAWIGTGVYIDNIDERKAAIAAAVGATVSRSVALIGSLALGIFVLCVLPLSLTIFRSIVRPLAEATEAAGRVAAGDFGVALAVAGSDEVSRLEEALNSMAATLGRNMAQIEAKTREAEDKARAAEQSTREAEAARAEAERAKREGLTLAASRLESVVARMSAASEEIATSSSHIIAATETQKERIDEAATAMEEMNATVLEVAKSAAQAASGAETAKSQATDGNDIVRRSVAAMEALLTLSGTLKKNMDVLGQRAKDVNQIMNVISDIADQTNLLALNAAIEAARAGDAGRGFAVVADEVRKLAEKTMNATKEVGATIQGIHEVTGANIQGMDEAARAIAESTGLVQRSGQALDEIVRMSDQTAVQVQSIATAAEEQSAASEEINQSVALISSIATENAEGLREAGVSIRELAEQAGQLRLLIEDLKREGGGER
jgi:methyl-accepting chemotaxis protein